MADRFDRNLKHLIEIRDGWRLRFGNKFIACLFGCVCWGLGRGLGFWLVGINLIFLVGLLGIDT